MSLIRIMHVVDSFGTGGTEGGIRKLLSGLDSDLFEQIVCTVVPFHGRNAPDAKTPTNVISVGRAHGGKQVLIGKFKRVFERERPHIVHSRNWGTIEAIAAARLAGVRGIVHSEHGLESSTHLRQPLRRNAIRRLLFPWTDRVFAVSQALSEYYARQLGLGENRPGVISNGVDTRRFQRREDLRRAARAQLGVGPDTLVVGAVGRLDPIKDHVTLFRALSGMRITANPVQLVIVGDGPERQNLTTDTRRRQLTERVTFVGETNDIVSQLNSFDVFVLPSLAEGMSNALLEAMSTCLPCVATSVGGNPELVEHGLSGLLFDAGNAEQLSMHLNELAANPHLRQHLGGQARKRVENLFSLDRMLNNYTRLYEETLDKRAVHRTRLRAGHIHVA